MLAAILRYNKPPKRVLLQALTLFRAWSLVRFAYNQITRYVLFVLYNNLILKNPNVISGAIILAALKHAWDPTAWKKIQTCVPIISIKRSSPFHLKHNQWYARNINQIQISNLYDEQPSKKMYINHIKQTQINFLNSCLD